MAVISLEILLKINQCKMQLRNLSIMYCHILIFLCLTFCSLLQVVQDHHCLDLNTCIHHSPSAASKWHTLKYVVYATFICICVIRKHKGHWPHTHNTAWNGRKRGSCHATQTQPHGYPFRSAGGLWVRHNSTLWLSEWQWKMKGDNYRDGSKHEKVRNQGSFHS